MGFPSTLSKQDLGDLWTQAVGKAAGIKTEAANNRAAMAAGPFSTRTMLDMVAVFKDARAAFDLARATPGMVAYARVQINDPARDIVGEFNAMVAAVDDALVAINTSFPRSSDGYLKAEKLEADHTHTLRRFTTAETAALLPKLDTLIATID